MKKLTSSVILMAGAIVACQSAFGQVGTTRVADDLYLGFANYNSLGVSQGTADYIINLGPAATLTNNTSVVNLSSEFNLTDYDAIGGDASTIAGGVIGGQNASSGSPTVFLTLPRNPAVTSPSVAGSSVSAVFSGSSDDQAYSVWANLNAPTGSGAGVLDANKTWETYVDADGTLGNASSGSTFFGKTGFNPDSALSDGPVLYSITYEDLYESTSPSVSLSESFTYLGYFTLDLSAASPLLTYTPAGASVTLAAPTVTSVTETNGVTTITFNSVANHYYTLEYTTALPASAWTPVNSPAEIQASGSSTTVTDNNATDQVRFYQVIAHY